MSCPFCWVSSWSCDVKMWCMMRRTDWMLMWIESDPSAVPGSLLPVAVLGLLWHSCEWRLQAAQVVVELAGVTQHKQVLILVFLADATATDEVGDVTARQRQNCRRLYFFRTTSSPDHLMVCASPVEDCWQAGGLPWRFTLLFAGLPLFGGF